MTPELAAAKKELRALVNNRLNDMLVDRVDISNRLYENLTTLTAIQNARVVGIFVDFRNELPTRYFIPKLFDIPGNSAETRIVAVPFCVGKEMEFYKLDRPTVDPQTHEPTFADLEPMSFGILEPSVSRRELPGAIVSPQAFDVMIAPGVAFDLQGRRLGRGAGFYDRYLPKLRKDAVIIGIGYDEQLVDEVPTDENDFKVHAFVTPSLAVTF